MSLPSNPYFTGRPILDASVLFNVLATGCPVELLRALGIVCFVEARTAAEIKRMPGEFRESQPLLSLLNDGCLQIVRMSEQAYQIYLSLVGGASLGTLDDGESAAIALAADGGGCVILDDRKARRIHCSRFPDVPCASSLLLFFEAARRGGMSDEQLRGMLRRARSVGRMAVLKEERSLFEAICPDERLL